MIRFFCVRGELVVAEHRHVLRAGQHRGVDLLVGGVVQRRRALAGRQRRALARGAVAGRAVEPEQLAAVGDARRRCRAGCPSGCVGPPPIGLDVGARAARSAPRRTSLPCARVGALPGERHAAGGDLEVDRRAADADQRRALALDALEVRAVAGDAADLVQLLAGGDVGWRSAPVSAAPDDGGERGVARRPSQAERAEQHDAGADAAAQAGASRGDGARAARGAAGAVRRRVGTGGRDGRLEAVARSSTSTVGRRGRSSSSVTEVPSLVGRVSAAGASAHRIEVDRREQADPHDVDEVPVVGHDDRRGGLRRRELAQRRCGSGRR